MKFTGFNIVLVSTILLINYSCLTVTSQNFNKQKLDSLFMMLAEKNQAMGSLAVSKDGILIYDNAIGFSSISESESHASTIRSRYAIASVTKMFTATMIFQLIEEGKIKLNTTLDIFYPEIPNAHQVTIGNLLNHRSGLFDYTQYPDYVTWMSKKMTHDEMISRIAKGKVCFQPNEKASYCNSGYILLGYIIEKVTNKSYSENLSQRITSVIRLSNTYFGHKRMKGSQDAFSYRFVYSWEQMPETDESVLGGAGGITSTPSDLTKFMDALFSMKLISNNSLSYMKKIADGFGMGLFKSSSFTENAYYHTGNIDGFVSELFYSPNDNLSVAYCSNGMVYPLCHVMNGIFKIIFNKNYSIPEFKDSTFVLKSECLNRYTGTYVSMQVPLKVNITNDNEALAFQIKGQPKYIFKATEKDKFEYGKTGITLLFNFDKDEMIYKEGANTILFKKSSPSIY